MSIQSGINQLLGMTALATQLPSLQKLAEGRNLREQASSIQERQKELVDRYKESGVLAQEGTVQSNIMKDLDTQLTDVRKKQFELNPSQQSLREYTKQRSISGGEPVASVPISPEEIAEEQAMQSMQQKGQQQVKQRQKRRNFMNYLRDFEDNWGGKVGDYPPKIQKLAAQQYTTKERKQIMDEIDRRRNNNKGNK